MSILGAQSEQENEVPLAAYNAEIERADAEIETGNYIRHEDVELFFQKRRESL
jgi:hypothetical protein